MPQLTGFYIKSSFEPMPNDLLSAKFRLEIYWTYAEDRKNAIYLVLKFGGYVLA